MLKRSPRKMSNAPSQKIETINLSDIEVNPSWNARTLHFDDNGALVEASGGPNEDSENSFADLVQSIKLKGQDTPVSLRPQKGRKPFFLVTGHRRYFAIQAIARETGNKTPTIKATVKEMTDVEARELNIRENTARDGLGGADLAFGLGALIHANPGITGSAAAQMLGMNQSYVAKLIRIVNGVKPNILKQWRESTVKVTVDQMDKLASVSHAEQTDAFAALQREKEQPSARGKNAWVETAKKKAVDVGTMLGKLVRDGHLDLKGDDFFGETIRTLVTFKSSATDQQVARIAGAAEKAFEVALETEAEPAQGDSKEAAPKAAKGSKAKNGAQAQAAA